MGKTAFMFPGQGAQYVGMGKDFYEQIPVSREMFELAGKASGLDVAALCFEENEQINITEYTQIAMLATEVAMLKAIEEKGFKPDVTAGLSLGEYGALAASGVMSAEDVFKVVRKRGIYMQEAVPNGGAMVAVLGLDTAVIEKICEETEGFVSIANYNCPGQIVITGKTAAVEAASEKLKEAGAKRVMMLNVSGPFHSPLLVPAGEELSKELETVNLHPLNIPYVTNVTARKVEDIGETKELLRSQVSSPVRWMQSMEYMIKEGVDTFVEIGPGKTLAGFLKKIDRSAKVCNIASWEDMERVTQELV